MSDENPKPPFRTEHLLWAAPLLALAGAVVVRVIAKEPLTIGMLVGALALGWLLAVLAVRWSRRTRRYLERELSDADGRLVNPAISSAIEAERLRLLGECVAGVAHELNNPLTGVIGYLQLAQREDCPPNVQAVLGKVGREAERMAHTIRTLLGFARKRSPERVPSDLNDVVRQVCDFQGFQLGLKGICLETNLGELPSAKVDPHQIRQVLLNLVKNAEDALEEVGRGGTVQITTRAEAETFRITVEDDGPGVPDEVGVRVFEHFFTTKPSGKGTGLGLSICRQIVESHGGRIELSAGEHGGARFDLELPAIVEEAAPRPEPAAERLAPGLRALIADDEEGVREYVATVLRDAGIEVLEASGGEEAIELARAHELDIVILDLKMPRMGGDVCSRRIRELRPSLEGRVVIMSGDLASPPDGEFFLGKPMSPEEILSAVARATDPAAVTL